MNGEPFYESWACRFLSKRNRPESFGIQSDYVLIIVDRSRYDLSYRFEVFRRNIDQIDRQTVVRDHHIFTIPFLFRERSNIFP